MRPIDADALKAKFCNHCDERDCKPDATDTVYGCVIADTIDNMPTIEAEPVKHGRWELISQNKFTGTKTLRCTYCKNYFVVRDDTLNAGRGDANFCPNCGAKMDGESE